MGARQPASLPHLCMGDQVDVDVARGADDVRADAWSRQHGSEPGSSAAAQYQLGGILGAGELQQRVGNVVSDDLVVGAAQGLDKLSLGSQVGWVGAGEPVGAGDVHRKKLPPGRSSCDARGASDQRLAFGSAGQGHDDAFAGLPGLLNLVLLAVQLQGLVDLVCSP